MTFKDLKHTGLKLDQYHTLLTFLGINWKLGKGKVFEFSKETYQTILELINKYGVGNSLANYIKTQNSLKKYGLSSPNQLESKRKSSSQKLKERIKRGETFGFINIKKEERWNYKTLEEKQKDIEIKYTNLYGENWKDLSINDKSIITRTKNNTLQSSENVQQKRKNTVLKDFNNYILFEDLGYNNYFRNLMLSENILKEEDFIQNKGYNLLRKDILTADLKKVLNEKWNSFLKNCKKFSGKSKYENEIEDFLKSLNMEFSRNDYQIIKPKELDFYIPSKKVGIEFDGLFFHSSQFKSKNYHLEKTELCNSLGIRLIHIFEDSWVMKKEICKSIIKSALGIYDKKIYARKCIFKKIDFKEGREFVNKNHIQGAVNGGEYFGLYYEGNLIQIIQIGKSRFKKGEIELLRMCSLLNTQVIGGFSKLLKNQPYNNFISYVDRSLYNGIGYEKCGFRFLTYTKPNYFYIVKNIRENRIKYQKHKLSKLLTKFDNNKSEVENMKDNGYYQIFDCGNIKVAYER